MRKYIQAALTAAFVLPVSFAFAEARPQGSVRDKRIQTADYHSDEVYRIKSQIGQAVMVQLEDGETLSGDTAALGMGDADAWKVAVKGNNIIFKPTAVRPETNMLITTDKRTYVFALSLIRKGQQPTYLLRFNYPDSVKQNEIREAERTAKILNAMQENGISPNTLNTGAANNFDYRAYGDKALAPTAAWDNGRFTYFRFNNSKDLPTVYRLMPDGTEALVNLHIEKDTMVIHETGKSFVLRLGKAALGIDNRSHTDSGAFNRGGTDGSGVRLLRDAGEISLFPTGKR